MEEMNKPTQLKQYGTLIRAGYLQSHLTAFPSGLMCA